MADLAMAAATTAPAPADRFAGLHTNYSGRIAAYIAPQLRGRDHQLVEDLTQETFLRAWRSLPNCRITDDTKMFRWLSTIARHAITDHYRIMRNTREMVMGEFADTWANRNLTPAASGAYAPVRTGTTRTAVAR